MHRAGPSVRRSPVALAAVLLLLAGIAARLHNAWSAPVLAGYDAFGHFTYIWFVADTGRIPLPTQGWSFFHPPLYYGGMAWIWELLSGLDPVSRLRVGKVAVAALGVLHAAVAWQVVGRAVPSRPGIRAMAAALTMLLPVQLYSAGFLGNEGLHAVLGTLSLAAALLLLDRATVGRALALGLCLGLAMLAKFSAVAVAAAMLAAVAWRLWRRGGPGPALRSAGLAAAAMLLVCGPYYARSVVAYGTPFQLSRPTFAVSYVEANQPQAARGPLEYLSFDPMIFRRPVWPREAGVWEDAQPYGVARSVRESVWTGLYANTWFDGFGGWVLPPVVESEAARRSGQALLLLGLVPTGLMLFGAWTSLRRALRRGWDDTTAVMALATASMLVLFVYGTRQAPIAAAVKATYFTPIVVAFAFWFAQGLAWLDAAWPRGGRVARVGCGALALLSLAVFWQGFVFDSNTLGHEMPRMADAKATQLGIVEYAGGRRAAARRAFEQAAASNYHLAWENLAFLAAGEGRLREARQLLARASRLQREQLDGGPVRRDEFLAGALAEYEHSIAVVQHRAGRRADAIRRWHEAVRLDPRHAEALWCLALARLEAGLATGHGEASRRLILGDAARALHNVRVLDPGLDEGWWLGAAVEAAAGDCDDARALLEESRSRPSWMQRSYPAPSGTGAAFTASIGRRRLIEPRRAELRPGGALAACGLSGGESGDRRRPD